MTEEKAKYKTEVDDEMEMLGEERKGEYEIIYKNGIRSSYPYGIRNKGGYILFFREVKHYADQDRRYYDEVKKMDDAAQLILSALNNARVTPPDSVEEKNTNFPAKQLLKSQGKLL